MSAELLIGDPAPDFQALAVGAGYPPGGAVLNLASLRGQRVVLCFYPQNDTPGCNEQACAIRDVWEKFTTQAALFGVNNDTPEGHARIIARLDLPFPLLSDTDNLIAKAYGLWLGDGGGGDVEGGEATERSTFIIGTDGRIQAIMRKIRPTEHARALLGILST